MTGPKLSIDAYREVAPPGTIDLLCRMSEQLKGKSMVHVNSTRWGGGVAEMLHRILPLLEDLGLNVRWEVIEGTPSFYHVTKSFHNALQGENQTVTDDMYEDFVKVNRQNGRKLDLDADYVIIHDPQPVPLIYKKRKKSAWLWRCHIDASHPQRSVWNFLKKYVSDYDGAIFSLPSFAQKLSIPQYLMYPSIDPLADKNRELDPEEIDAVLNKYGIPKDKPMIVQVSRFDRFKDPVGVIEAYKMVKKYNECCLVLAGGGAADDPEGQQVLDEVKAAADKDDDIFILDLPPDSNVDINALQRAAAVVLQKSLKEGFGLTVAEAMWKGRPVIGGFVGGITVQIVYGQTGLTVNSVEGCAYRIRYLLNNPEKAKWMGERAREYTRRNFLVTRHLSDYLALMTAHLNQVSKPSSKK